ncbi:MULTISPECIES: hypothetical protein [Chryseobacterium]|uniref:hypothetical protein n=1 Tax=Chryseobacterium TaxID=59732 RepID=UPI000FA5018F|nr:MULTISPECIES: hypothetical protein [Chryseobacterium]MBM7417702.1 hypothetical protein [Chryseobacterium sp. JUb44]MDH6211895.1 hypothetical protein [Chryseobacterium sp. BIGb0186]WSO10528.1 hypothetical protein VUJ64_01110 [Chryseobacterium scophthalmum]
MRKYLYLIILSLSLVSCYTYQVKKTVDTAIDNKQASKNNAALANTNTPQTESIKAKSQNQSQNLQQTPTPVNVQEKLAPNKNVKIDVDGRAYKVIVDRWEGDSLIAHPVHSRDKVLKFHKNQINAEKIAEKRFSQPIADIITVVAYAGIGFGIWSLLQ